MSSIVIQRNLVAKYKKETFLNLEVVSKVHPIPSDIYRQLFKENALEKLTQNVFTNLSYYLLSIINPQKASKLPWPIYDSLTERAYRNELYSFISDYSTKGLLSPIMSSYLVNPGNFKVTILVFQLSLLAVQHTLKTKMKDNQKKLYNEMTEQYKCNEKSVFVENIEKETAVMLSKFSNYLHKRNTMEKIAELFRIKILQMEKTLALSKAQDYIDNLIDLYIKQNTLDDVTKADILQIKDISAKPDFFNQCLKDTDKEIDELEKEWNTKALPIVKKSQLTMELSETLISRHTNNANKSSYMIEYNPTMDDICTTELQNQVNSEQKFILKNIVRDEKLNFPNLVRGFMISVCFILRNIDVGDEIYKFNEYVEGGRRKYDEMVEAMRDLLDKVVKAEFTLEPSSATCNQFISLKDYEIPPLPDLSDLKSNKDLSTQVFFNTFTPLGLSKHKFNLHRNTSTSSCIKPYSKSLFITPFHQRQKEDFLKSLISCRVGTYDKHNLSLSQVNTGNRSIAEGSGFTKQQIFRLLTTKKSSTKKFKHKLERIEIPKKGALFNESSSSNESNVLFRSYSSPNLNENRKKISYSKLTKRELSIMKEDSPILLEVSGITVLDSNFGSPGDDVWGAKVAHESTRKEIDNEYLSSTVVKTEAKLMYGGREIGYNKNLTIEHGVNIVKDMKSVKMQETKPNTPENNQQPIKKTSSIEKIINRFKKVRASVIPMDKKDEEFEYQTIIEEKDYFNFVNKDAVASSKVLLPDLLSPSCNAVKSNDYLDQPCMTMDSKDQRRPRESLGAALGVDNTFLDQFNLID